jgi:tetratricopeptide (TPR) repeat protein
MARDAQLASERFDAADALANTPGLRAMVLNQRARAKADPREALALLERGLVELRQAYGDASPLIGRSYVEIANKKFQLGDLDGAEAAWRSAGEVYHGAFGDSDAPIMADYLQMGGLLAQSRQRPDEARTMLSRAAAVYGEAGLTLSQAQAEANLANLIAFELDDRKGAEPHYRQALVLVERARGRESADYAELEASLGIFLAAADCAAGAAYLGHARQVLEPMRRPILSSVLGQLGDCARTTDRERAAANYEGAIALCTERGCEPGMLEHLHQALGTLLVTEAKTRGRGLALLHNALDGYSRLGDAESVVEVKKALTEWEKRR